MSDPTREEIEAHLTANGFTEAAGYFDFDRDAAIYWFSYNYHGGQTSNLYSILSTSEFRPGLTHRSVTDEGVIAELIYKELMNEFGSLEELD